MSTANCFDVEQPLINLEGNFLFQLMQQQQLCTFPVPGCIEIMHLLAALNNPKIKREIQLSQLLKSLLSTLPRELSPGMVAILGWFSVMQPDDASMAKKVSGPAILNAVGFVSFLSWLKKNNNNVVEQLKEYNMAKKVSGTEHMEIEAKNQMKSTSTELEKLRRDLEERAQQRKILCGAFGIVPGASGHTITLI
jgi:hypothetical protein